MYKFYHTAEKAVLLGNNESRQARAVCILPTLLPQLCLSLVIHRMAFPKPTSKKSLPYTNYSFSSNNLMCQKIPWISSVLVNVKVSIFTDLLTFTTQQFSVNSAIYQKICREKSFLLKVLGQKSLKRDPQKKKKKRLLLHIISLVINYKLFC